MDISVLIKQARIAKGLTQAELAKIIGVQASAVSKWEKGRVDNIKRNNLKTLAETLDIDVAVLAGYEDEQYEKEKSMSLIMDLWSKLTPENKLELLSVAQTMLNKNAH